MAGLTGLEDEGLWSEETRRLCDVVDEIPTLVRVTEGIYSCNDAETFSQGDIIKLDACERMTRVSAFLTQPGRETKYVKYGEELSLPYDYPSLVEVLPIHGVHHKYRCVQDLIDYFPRRVKVLERLDFIDKKKCSKTLLPDDILELKAVRRDRLSRSVTSLRCLFNGENVLLPPLLKGIFQVLPDEIQRTLREVVDTYKLPQCVRFINSGLEAIMSRDIQLAVDNLQSFNGEMIVTEKMQSAPKLFGHYKGMQGVDAADTGAPRTAVIIPLELAELRDLLVNLPNLTDPSLYDNFLRLNFSNLADTGDRDSGMYVDVVNSPRVLFYPISPPLPPRRSRILEPSTGTLSRAEPKTDYLAPVDCPSMRKATLMVQPSDSVKAAVKDGKLDDNPIHQEQLGATGTIDSDVWRGMVNATPIPSSQDEVDYDYIDDDITEYARRAAAKFAANAKKKHDISARTASVKPTMRPQPEVESSEGRELVSILPVIDMSVSELCKLLMHCGMDGLSNVCRKERVDGTFFASLTAATFKKKPFSLSEYQITKVNKILGGWRPKL